MIERAAPALRLVESDERADLRAGFGSRSGIVERPRLLAKLEAAGDVPVVLVVAGAGYGKTTLLSQWASRDDRPLAWFTLTERHDDPAELMGDVVQALDGFEPFDPRTRRSLDASTADFTSVVLPRFERAVASRTRPFVMVLDDLHIVQRPAAWAIIQALADRLPEGSQLALASRARPPLHLSRMRANRRLVHVSATQLAMTRDEAGQLIAGSGLTLADAQLQVLADRTEGWAAGLYLASLALRDEANPVAACERFAGDDHLVADYLRDEMLRVLPPRTREFLVRTSVLDVLSGPACDAVLDRSDSTKMLDATAAADLMLIPLDRRGESYRYHLLFRDMLRFELHRSDPDLEATLHARASAWFRSQGDPDAAISHAHAAGDEALVDELLWWAAPTFTSIGRTATVERWLEPYTAAEIASRPALAISAAWAAVTKGDLGTVGFWSAIANEQDPFALLPDGTPVGAAAALLRAALAKDGIATMRKDAADSFALDRAGSLFQSIACYLEGVALRIQGDRVASRERLEVGVAIGKLLSPAAHVHCLTQLGVLAIEEDDWPEAVRLVEDALEVIEGFALHERPVMASPYAAAALVRAYMGDGALARSHSKHAVYLLSMLTSGGPWLAIDVRLLLARAALLVGDVALARVLAREAGALLELVPDAEQFRLSVQQLLEATDIDQVPLGVSATPMTPAELRVLRYLPTHLTFAAIAEELFVSRNTVKTQAVSIYRKLGVSSRDPAVATARRLGLLEE